MASSAAFSAGFEDKDKPKVEVPQPISATVKSQSLVTMKCLGSSAATGTSEPTSVFITTDPFVNFFAIQMVQLIVGSSGS